MALATISKGNSTINEYFVKMKGLVYDMASAGRKLEDEELVSYILTSLDLEFNPVVSVVAARVEPITVGELYTQLISFKQRMEIHGGGGHQSLANLVAKGDSGGGSSNNTRGGCRSGHGGFGRGSKGGHGGARP